ncbi:MAG: hypothetical protein KDD47_11150, partial [Acidobacteria bacterium]|nr:hypothetical protein [Acidobacteriota bacterium]
MRISPASPSRSRWFVSALLVALVAAGAAAEDSPNAAPASADAGQDESPGERSTPTLPARHAEWLSEVRMLIKPQEEEVFRQLSKDYQRDAF